MKRQYFFWFVIAIFFLFAASGIFWLNYSFDRETKIMFADEAQSVVRSEKPVVDTSSWKTYENKKFGFGFKYPPELQTFPCSGVMLFCMNIGEKNFAFQDNGFAVRIYDRTRLQSHDESGFSERAINGILWRFKAGDTQAFRMDVGQDKEFRVFANPHYALMSGIIVTFQFVK